MASSPKTAALVGGALSNVLLVNCLAPLDGAPAAPHCYLEPALRLQVRPLRGNQAHAGRKDSAGSQMIGEPIGPER